MSPTRQDLLDLIEETYGDRHPDFESIQKQFELIGQETDKEEIRKDTNVLIAGVQAIKNTYEDWDELSDFEREKAIGAVGRMKNLTKSTLKKYDVSAKAL
ncbi:hypothetical protein [Salinibacter sp.]|uniref:hypothetical protein n=1 Tax=Salinibacter sp. TaxID=2065818 RepID=UPI002FC35412